MNKLEDAMKLLPISLQSDPVVVAMFEAAIIQLQELYDEAMMIVDFVNIDKLPEDLLDLIAFEKHVDFYDIDLSLNEKRNLIKNSISWHRKKGTPYAVNLMFKMLNLDCFLEEWFEYNGRPYFFKVNVNVSNTGITNEQIKRLFKMVFFSKNLRSHLEKISIYYRKPVKPKIATISRTGISMHIQPYKQTSHKTLQTTKYGFYNHHNVVMKVLPKFAVDVDATLTTHVATAQSNIETITIQAEED